MNPSRVIVLPTCSICQDEDAGLDIVTTTCGHAFHSSCIRQWDSSRRAQRQTTKCPSCNVDLQRASLGNSRFIRLHSLTEKILNLPSSQPHSDPEIELKWQECIQELSKSKETLRQKEVKVNELMQEPESLKRERNTLQLKIKSLESKIRDLEGQNKSLAHDRHTERRTTLIQRNAQLNENNILKSEIERLNDKCRTLKNDQDQLQEQLALKLSENEELQSFVSDFSREKKRFETVESELRTQLQDSLKQTQTLKIANQLFNRKLEESKQKMNLLQNQFGGSTLIASVRHCSKFHPEGSKSPIISNNVTVITSKAKGKQPENSAQSSFQATGCSNRTKRLRKSNNNFDSQAIEIKSDSDDVVICSPSSTPLNIPSSSPSQRKSKAEENLFLPSLFGNDTSKFNERSFSTKNNQKSVNPSRPRSFDHSFNPGSSSFLSASRKLIASGPKIRHR